MRKLNLFLRPGATVICDGQYGSTGKGVIAGMIVENFSGSYNKATANAGPNSGHTAFLDGTKVVTQQLPITGLSRNNKRAMPITYLNGGAIIDPEILRREAAGFGEWLYGDIYINPQAAVINDECRQSDILTVQNISSTGKGTGPALARKVSRLPNSVYKDLPEQMWDDFGLPSANFWNWGKDFVTVECSQGFSLGYHSNFYPHTTSRECSVQQAIADARIPFDMVQDVIMCCRTFPIRVGSVGPTGSGGHYDDQIELRWDSIGQDPELTTVTKRERRLFSWSRKQYIEALSCNHPTVVFVNFMNYLPKNEVDRFLTQLREDTYRTLGGPTTILLGWGPLTSDIEVL